MLFATLLGGCSADQVARLERENKMLAEKLEASTKAVKLDGQDRCAQQALRYYQASEIGRRNAGGYTNHYSVELSKCFIEMGETSAKQGVISVSRTLVDAFEGKSYGEYYWTNPEKKKYWEVKPYVCMVTDLDGKEVDCVTDQEYGTLIKRYMEHK